MTEYLDGEFHERDPSYQLGVLSTRVGNLGKEKERLEADLRDERSERRKERDALQAEINKLEDRLAAIEKSFQRGFGMLLIIPVIGSIAGFVFAYGKMIFGPWLTKS